MLMSVRGAIAATLLAGTALAATPAFADEADAPSDITVSGNVALASEYRFRGVAMTGGDMAIQGGITVTHSSGFYVSTWSSSLDDGGTDTFGDQELDLIAGWSGEVASGISLDAGLLYYVYPSGNGNVDYFEPYASVSGDIGPAAVKVGVAYAWDQSSLGSEDNTYVFGNVDVGIPDTPVTVSGHLGYTWGVLAPGYLTGNNVKTGWDYSIGASTSLFGPLSLGVSYIGVSGPSVKNFTDDAVVATLTASF